MAVTPQQIKKFVKYCVQEPKHAQDPVELQKNWKHSFFEYTVRRNESLASIAKDLAIKKKAPRGFDWKWLSRFNFGVDYPPYVNYKLIDTFGLDERANITRDKKNYLFKGGEKLKIPLRPGVSVFGRISPNRRNVINRPKIKITSVKGPTFTTVDIASFFEVTGYLVPDKDVTQTKKDSIHWWIKNVTKGGDGEDSGKTGEKVKITFTKAQVDAGDYRIGDWIRVYPYFDDKSNINELIYVQCRLIEVELKHDVPRTKINKGSIAATDPINFIHNPATAVIGARTTKTCAKFKLTKVTSDTKVVSGKNVKTPAIAVNDEGFIWKTTEIKGKAKFVKIKGKPDDKGSDCLVHGTEPGYIRLEGWCVLAEKYCVSKIVKVVNERKIPFRVNLLTAKNGLTTNETVQSLQTVFKVQNIYLRPVGVSLVPDSNSSTGEAMSDENVALAQKTVSGKNVNIPGYFNVTNVDNQYVNCPAYADAEAASKINARPNVVNYVLLKKIVSNSTLGYGPTAMRNLHTQPTEGRGNAVNGMLKTYTGPDEDTEWLDHQSKFNDSDIDDVSKIKSLKKMQMFTTPDTNLGHKNFGGVIIPHSASPGPVKTSAQLTEAGATYAHELGHVVSIRHRGGKPSGEGEKPDLLPSNVNNVMYWTEDTNHSPADWDLIQADVFRGCILCSHDSNKGGLSVKASTPSTNKLSGYNGSEKTFNLEVLRNKSQVAGAYLNFWLEGTRTAIKIKEVSNWSKTSRKMSTGLSSVKIEFTGSTGDKATLVVMAGDNDDLVAQEIICTVAPTPPPRP